MSLSELIRERILQAQERIAGLRIAISNEESNLRKWREALALETEEPSLHPRIAPQSVTLPRLTLESIRTKEATIVALLRDYPKGLKSAQIIKAVHPAIARSSVYGIIKRMKELGKIEQTSRGFVRLRSTEKGEAEATPLVPHDIDVR